MTKWQANIRNMRDIGNEINVIKGIRTTLDSSTLKISTLHPFELLVIIYQITGRSQKTWIFINLALLALNYHHANKTHKKLLPKLRTTVSYHPCTWLGSKLYKKPQKMHKQKCLVKCYLKSNQCDKIRIFTNIINMINIKIG